MKRLSRTLLFFTLAALVITSCSIEKRVYRKGYHFVWNVMHSREAKKHETLKNEKLTLVNETFDKEVVVSANRLSDVDLVAKKPTLILNKDTCGDILLLQNADELAVRIFEIDEQTIKYKRCDNMDGPIYSIKKNKVAMITYANGIKEKVIAEPEPIAKKSHALRIELPIEPKLNKAGLWSLLSLLIIMALLFITIMAFFFSFSYAAAGVIILLAIGLVLPLTLAYFSLGQFRKDPNKYRGKWMPIVTISFFLINLVRIVIAMAIIGSVLELIGGIIGLLGLLGLMIYLLIPKKRNASSAK